jgi:hypothetical protein
MTTSEKLTAKFGTPAPDFERQWMELAIVPEHIHKAIPCLPPKIYINKLLTIHLWETFSMLISKGLSGEIKTFDGCFNIRKIRGSETVMSIHSWGLAIDLNAKENPLNGQCMWSPSFLKVWKEMGWTLGADFKRVDAMHFEFTNI